MGIGPCSKDPPRQSKRDMIDNRQGTCSAGMKGRPTRNVPSVAGTEVVAVPMPAIGNEKGLPIHKGTSARKESLPLINMVRCHATEDTRRSAVLTNPRRRGDGRLRAARGRRAGRAKTLRCWAYAKGVNREGGSAS